MQAQLKKIKGFSLLEVLVVLAIVGIISAIAIPNFSSMSKDRKVRIEAERIKDLIVGINSQVQRGSYGFGQFVVETEDSGKLSFSTNGMLTTKLAQNIGVPGWHSSSTRCEVEESSSNKFDHYGKSGTNPEVRHFETDEVNISISNGAVCFSKDGTYFSKSGDLDDENLIYVCSKNIDSCPDYPLPTDPKRKNYIIFEINWTRFGNVKLEKYNVNTTGWAIQ